jgi:hypothetical protein
MKVGLSFILIVMIVISLIASLSYPGTQHLFIIFCAVFLLTWAFAWIGFQSYFYIFFTSLNLLGFWMKACAHLILGQQFVESTGSFDGSGEAWDSAIVVCICAGLGVLCFRLLQMYLKRKERGVCLEEPSIDFVPFWYKNYRNFIYIGSFFAIAMVALLNYKLGINQAGLLPKTYLPFKLSAIIIWCLYSAFAFSVVTIVWWDLCIGLKFRFELLVFEAIASSITVFSRGLYITHIGHYFLSILFNKKFIKLSVKKITYMFVLFLLGLAIVLISVAELRKQNFYSPSSEIILNSEEDNDAALQEGGIASPQFKLLLTGRWIGLEGVLSTSAYSKLGIDLFREGWLVIPSYNSKPVYEHVTKSIYIDPDYPNAEKYNFLSTPGLVAMLYFSGSLIIVFIGVLMFLFVISFGEDFTFKALRNPFAVSLYGIIMAMMLHQFGGLYLNLIQLFEISSFIIFLWAVKKISKYFEPKKL